MQNSNGQTQKVEIETPGSKLEHLRGILFKLQQAMQARRDERTGHKPAPKVEQSIAFPKTVSTASVSGKPRATPKSLSEFEAAFARLTNRQAS